MEIPGQPDRFEALLRQELAPGERLLWHARAIPRAKRESLRASASRAAGNADA
mgnify:CR=1 FL=1